MNKIKIVICPLGSLQGYLQDSYKLIDEGCNVLFHYIRGIPDSLVSSHVEFLNMAIENLDLIIIEVDSFAVIDKLIENGIDIVAMCPDKLIAFPAYSAPECEVISRNFSENCSNRNIQKYVYPRTMEFSRIMDNLNTFVKNMCGLAGPKRYQLAGIEKRNIWYESQMVCYRMVVDKIAELESDKDSTLDDETRGALLSTLKRELIILEKLQNSALDSIGKQLDQYRLLMKNAKLYLIDEDQYKYMCECVDKIEQIKGLM